MYTNRFAKNFIALLCVALVLISLLSFFVAATSAFHICKKSSCPICRFMDMVADHERSLTYKSRALFIVLAVMLIIRSMACVERYSTSATPITLMVRMND